MLSPVCGLHLRVFYDLVLQGFVIERSGVCRVGLGFRVGGLGLGLGVVESALMGPKTILYQAFGLIRTLG